MINVRDIHGSLDAIISLSSESPSVGWSSGVAIVISPLVSETKLNSYGFDVENRKTLTLTTSN